MTRIIKRAEAESLLAAEPASPALELVGSAPEGRVTALVGLVLRAWLPELRIGDMWLIDRKGLPPLPAEVVSFVGEEAALVPLGDPRGVGPNSRAWSTRCPASIGASEALLGRILNGLGEAIDGRGLVANATAWPIDRPAPDPLSRARIAEPLTTGVRAIDGLATMGVGQRLALVAGPGGGKSTLLGLVARSQQTDVVVVGLIGERGREVREFIEDALGAEARRRAVVVVATADEPALLRIRAAHVATAVAEYFRDQGRRVLLLLDSLTRYARAQREVGLACGEPPARQGFPPSVFERLPRLCERAGPAVRGSITALYAVLAPSGDLDDPIVDETMALVDGHIILDARAAASGLFPAIDPVRSLSRVMPTIVSPEHLDAAAKVRALYATLAEKQDLIALGARGDPALDRAIAKAPMLERFLRQGKDQQVPLGETLVALQSLVR